MESCFKALRFSDGVWVRLGHLHPARIALSLVRQATGTLRHARRIEVKRQ